METVRPGSPSHLPASNVKYHHPYFSPDEVEYLTEKQRGKMSVNQDKLRQQACAFTEAVGVKIGFPRKTIATAQNLYNRFHLFFPAKDFNYWDVTLACLYVSTKMHDTLKKPRDILMVSYTIRFPELAARSKVAGGDVEIDPATLEQDRQHLLGIERLVLETICFNFTVRMPFPYVIKIGRELGALKNLTRLAWRLAADSNRTLSPLQYPPHVVALACIYLAALLSNPEQAPENPTDEQRKIQELASLFESHGDWERKYQACIEDLQEIVHDILDLMIFAVQNTTTNTSTTNSPATPSSPPRTPAQRTSHPHRLATSASTSSIDPNASVNLIPFKHDDLMRIKIRLRNFEFHERPRLLLSKSNRKRKYAWVDPISDVLNASSSGSGLGKNEGTVRFVFGPERLVKPRPPLERELHPEVDRDEKGDATSTANSQTHSFGYPVSKDGSLGVSSWTMPPSTGAEKGTGRGRLNSGPKGA